jgi:predicted ATP-dependent endonuclease of OLD family
MHITKVIIKNYRCLKDTTVDLNPHLNILVGDNECGKSTFLEAVNLALDLLPCLPSFISRLCSGFGPCRGGLRTRPA